MNSHSKITMRQNAHFTQSISKQLMKLFGGWSSELVNVSVFCKNASPVHFWAQIADTGVVLITQYTHVRNKNSNAQGSSPHVVEVIFPYLKELLLKKRIRSLWEQILSFKRSSNFEKGYNCRELLLGTIISL